MRDKTRRRTFSADYKRRVLAEADACAEPGALAELLRREGLRASHLHAWRVARERGSAAALEPKRRGPKRRPDERARIVELERVLAAALERAQRAERLVAAQKKVSELVSRASGR